MHKKAKNANLDMEKANEDTIAGSMMTWSHTWEIQEQKQLSTECGKNREG